MRSLSTAIVAAAGALALAACGGSGESSKASSAPAATDTTAAVEPVPAEKAAPDATGIEPAASVTTEVVDASAAAHADSTMSMADAASVAPEGAVVPAAAAGGEDYAAFTGDATAGKRVFVKCLACHVVVAGQNRVGPSLYGIVGRPAGSIANFAYSPANKNSGIVWTEDVMFAYLKNPQAYIPGTKMVFPGLPSGQDRADVIAYLKSVPK